MMLTPSLTDPKPHGGAAPAGAAQGAVETMRDACFGCAHRRPLARPSRSKCRHPLTARVHAAPVAAIIERTGAALPVDIIGISVVGDPHAIEMGWFAWPINFDPLWLVSCDGFAAAPER